MKISKKPVSLLLCLCMVLIALCSMTVGAAADYGLIICGGFDTADAEDASVPQGWTLKDSNWVDESYVSIPLSGSGTSSARQIVNPASEAIAGKYTLSFRYKLATAEAARVYGYVYYTDETNGAFIPSTKLPASTAVNDDWYDFSVTTNVTDSTKTVEYVTIIFASLTEAEGALCVDDVALHKDYNLLANSAFSSITGWKLGSGKTYTESTGKYDVDVTGDKTVLAKFLRDDGACPEGDTYIQFDDTNLTNGIYNPYIVTNSEGFSEGMTFVSGTRYQFSVWYKSTASREGAVRIYIPMSGKTTDATWTSAEQAYIILPATNGEWKKTVITFEQLPDCTGFNVGMRAYAATLANGEYVAFNNPQLVALKESDCGLGMYDATGMGFVSGYEGGTAYANILGEPLTSLKGYTGTVSAVYSSLSGTTAANEEAVVLAVYEKDGDGVKRLRDVSIADVAVPESGDAYPTASLNLENVPTGSEVRAYVWNSISGLQPVDNYINLTK